MDFHAMKRKRLQSLCKKHGIPANLKNKEMADRLSLILKEKENDQSCHSSSDNAGTDQDNFQCFGGKDLLNDEQSSELNSNSVINLQMVSSDTDAGKIDAREKEKFVNSGKRSPTLSLEERVGFSPKLLKKSEIEVLEPVTNLSPEITRGDVEICDVEENMQSGVNKEHVDSILEEGLRSTPGVVVMNDVDLVQDATEEFCDHLENVEVEKLGDDIDVHDYVSGNGSAGEEVLETVDNVCVNGAYSIVNKEQVDERGFGNYLAEEKVENLGDRTDDQEEICGTRKGGAESDKQDDSNNLQGSDMNDKNHPLVFPDESGEPLLGGQAEKCDRVSYQFPTTNPLSEAKFSDLNIRQMVVSGDAAGNADMCEAKIVSYSKISRSPEIKGLNFETNVSPERPKDDIESFVMEENMQSGLSKDCVKDSQEVFHAAPSGLVMNNVDLEQVSSEGFGSHLIERGFEKLVDQNDLNEDVYGTGKGRVEDKKLYETNTPQGSNINDVNQEESGYPLVQEEAQKSDKTICAHGGVYCFSGSGTEVDTMCFADAPISAKDSGQNTNMTMEHFSDEVHPSNFKYSDISDLFLTTNTLSEAKSCDLNIHQFAVSGAADGNVDAWEARFVSSPKISSSSLSEKIFGPSASLLNDLENKGLEFETNLPPETQKTDIEMCDVEERMQTDVDYGNADENQEVLHAAASAVVMNSVDLLQVSSEVFGNHLVQREFENLADKSDLSEDAYGTGKGAAEAEKHYDTCSPLGSNVNGVNWEEPGCHLVEGEVQKVDDAIAAEKHGDTNKPQRSNINDLNQEEYSFPLVKGEFQISDDTSCVHGSVHNIKNCGTEGDLIYLLDPSINAKDGDGKTNVTADRFADQVHSSNFEYSGDMPDQFLATFQPSEVRNSDFYIHEMVASDTTVEKLESSQKKILVADPEDCIEFYSVGLGTSEIKEHETQTSVDPSTHHGAIVGTCNIVESMQSAKTDTVSGGEDVYQERLGSSPKGTPVASSKRRNNSFPKILESSMMKENINAAKKEQFGSTISKKTFPKRQPLQDLQQN